MGDVQDNLSAFRSKVWDFYINLHDNILNTANSIQKNTSDNRLTINIDEIEELIAKFLLERDKFDETYINYIISKINEHDIIKKVRQIYKNKNILFKTNRQVPLTLQTEHCKITLKRYLLSPKSSEDAQRLKELEGVKNIVPLDIALGISKLPFRLTVDAMLKVSKFAQSAHSFKSAATLLKEDCGMSLDQVTIMAVTNHIGSLAFNYEMDRAKKRYDMLTQGKLIFPDSKMEGTLYIQVDGAMINTREKDEKTKSSWHENKLGLVYSSENKRKMIPRKVQVLDESNGTFPRERYELLKKDYVAFIGSVDIFKILLFECAIRNGYGLYKQTILLSDGATWIRNMKDELFFDVQQILDFYHLSEKIWNFGKLFFNDDKNKYSEWCHGICDKFLESKSDIALEEIIKMEKKINVTTNKLSNYIINNKDNINYADYKRKGFDIGSGAIESSNKFVVQRRMKGPGMRWYINSAQNLVTLRAKQESGKWYEDVVVPVKNYYNTKS